MFTTIEQSISNIPQTRENFSGNKNFSPVLPEGRVSANNPAFRNSQGSGEAVLLEKSEKTLHMAT
jgi:hypothetical protein